MTTQYPSKIDDNTSLPNAIDNSTPVAASVVNRLKEAILAIQNELGTKPSGVVSNVKSRFSNIESSINNLNIIKLDKDLGGTLNNPKVIGLQGIPISSANPSSGQVLGFNGLIWGPINISGAFFPGGDLSGTSTSQTVIKLQGRSISNSAPTDKSSLVWSNTNNAWEPLVLNYENLGSGSQNVAAQQFTTTVDTKGTAIDVQPKNIETTNATITTIDSFTIPNNTTLIVSAVITAVKSDNSQGASYLRTASFRNNSGAVAQIGATESGGSFEDDLTAEIGRAHV